MPNIQCLPNTCLQKTTLLIIPILKSAKHKLHMLAGLGSSERLGEKQKLLKWSMVKQSLYNRSNLAKSKAQGNSKYHWKYQPPIKQKS